MSLHLLGLFPLVFLLLMFIALVMSASFVYLQSVKFPGVKISAICGSFLIKAMITILGARMKKIEAVLNKPRESLFETETLRIETFPITYDSTSSELYLKQDVTISHYTLRVYQPKVYREDGYPIVMYISGGGWMLGSIESSHPLCLEVSNSGLIVISVDYRKTPERPFPAGLNDCLNALGWIGQNYQKYNGNIQQLIITGESAGAHLAITTQIRLFSIEKTVLERESIPMIHYQGLMYPVTEYYKFGDSKYYSYVKYRDCGLLVDGTIMDLFWSQLVGDLSQDEVKSNQYLSPMSAVYPSNTIFYSKFPKGFVWFAEYDVVRDEGYQFAQAVNNASPKKLIIKEWKHGTHGFRFKRNYNDMANSILELFNQ